MSPIWVTFNIVFQYIQPPFPILLSVLKKEHCGAVEGQYSDDGKAWRELFNQGKNG